MFFHGGFRENRDKNRLKRLAHEVNRPTIHAVLSNKGIRRNAITKSLPVPKRQYPKKIWTKPLISKIDRLTSKENPPSQRQIAKECHVLQQTVFKVIH